MKHRGTKQIYTKKENWKTPRTVFDRLTSFVKEEEKTAFFTPKDIFSNHHHTPPPLTVDFLLKQLAD